MTPDTVFQRALSTLRFLWMALVGSTLVLMGVVFVVHPDAHQHLDPSVELILFAAAAGSAVASFVLPSVAMGNAVRALGEMVIPASPGAPARFREPVAVARKAVAVAHPTLIVSMALSEAISIEGLALHMLGGPMAHVLPLMGTGTLLALFRFPTAKGIAAPFEAATGARFTSA
jgi:hypothetical protein